MDYEIPAGVTMTPELWEKADLMYANGFENPVQMALEITDWKQVTCSFCGETFPCPSQWRDETLCGPCQDD